MRNLILFLLFALFAITTAFIQQEYWHELAHKRNCQYHGGEARIEMGFPSITYCSIPYAKMSESQRALDVQNDIARYNTAGLELWIVACAGIMIASRWIYG